MPEHRRDRARLCRDLPPRGAAARAPRARHRRGGSSPRTSSPSSSASQISPRASPPCSRASTQRVASSASGPRRAHCAPARSAASASTRASTHAQATRSDAGASSATARALRSRRANSAPRRTAASRSRSVIRAPTARRTWCSRSSRCCTSSRRWCRRRARRGEVLRGALATLMAGDGPRSLWSGALLSCASACDEGTGRQKRQSRELVLLPGFVRALRRGAPRSLPAPAGCAGPRCRPPGSARSD